MSNPTGTFAKGWGLVVLIGLVVMSTNVVAGTFVSFNGKFSFTYPDSWAQVDYQTAEFYLTRGDPENEVDFEAVFSEKETFVLFQGQYLILTVDTVGGLSPEQIDSVMADMSEEFDRPINETAPEVFMTGSSRDSIMFDRANNLVAIETEVAGNDSGPRVNLLVMKFYEQGIANYYFYTPTVEFIPSLPTYRGMVTSFSTQELVDALRSDDEVRIADLDNDDDSVGRYSLMFGGLFIILVIVLAMRIRSRNKKNKQVV